MPYGKKIARPEAKIHFIRVTKQKGRFVPSFRSHSLLVDKYFSPSHALLMETLAGTAVRGQCQPTISITFNWGSSRSSRSPNSVSMCLRPLRCSARASTLVDNADKFVEASKTGNLIPLYRCIFSDHLTPVLAYRCLVMEDERDAPSFLFESVEPGLQVSSIGRYSVVGAQPTKEIVVKENMVTIMDDEEGCRTEEIVEDPMVIPRRIMDLWKPQLIEGLPDAFCGGWVGYFSKLPFFTAPADDRNLPDVHLGLYDNVIVFDHVEKKAYVIHWVQLDRYSYAEEAVSDGMNRLETLVSRVHDIITRVMFSPCTSYFK